MGGLLNTTGVEGSFVDFVAGNHYYRNVSSVARRGGRESREERGAESSCRAGAAVICRTFCTHFSCLVRGNDLDQWIAAESVDL